MEGAGRDQSVGVNIRLPHEQGANRFIAQDPKLVEMRYFFTRKLMLMKESDGFIVLPGGFGTLDESFELLTLLQTGKAEPAPMVMLDVPGRDFWQGWKPVPQRGRRAGGPGVTGRPVLFHGSPTTWRWRRPRSSASTATTGRAGGWATCWCCGWPSPRRLRWPTSTAGSPTSWRPGSSARWARCRPSGPTTTWLDLPRLALRFDKIHYGRLRQLIDALQPVPVPLADPAGPVAPPGPPPGGARRRQPAGRTTATPRLSESPLHLREIRSAQLSQTATLVAECYKVTVRMKMSTDVPTRFASDLFESAQVEGARESRSAKQQLDHWARVGRSVRCTRPPPAGGSRPCWPVRSVSTS